MTPHAKLRHGLEHADDGMMGARPGVPVSASPSVGEDREPHEVQQERDYYAESRRVYAKLAPWYDAIVRPIRGLRRMVAVAAGVGPGTRVLDVATGTGEQAIAFGSLGAEVVGVDISPAMLRIARAKHRSANVTFAEADAQQLPYPDGSFDVASISFVLHEMPASVRGRALREMARVVRPGGTVLVVDYALPRNGTAAALVSGIVSLYERDCYLEFVRSDVPELLRTSGLSLRETRPALLGAAQVLIASRPRADVAPRTT